MLSPIQILPQFTSTVVELFSTRRDASVTRKAPKMLFLFIPRITIKKNNKQTRFMTILGDHKPAHCVRQSVSPGGGDSLYDRGGDARRLA